MFKVNFVILKFFVLKIIIIKINNKKTFLKVLFN